MQLRAKLFPCSILHLSIVLLAVAVVVVQRAVHVSPLDLSFCTDPLFPLEIHALDVSACFSPSDLPDQRLNLEKLLATHH